MKPPWPMRLATCIRHAVWVVSFAVAYRPMEIVLSVSGELAELDLSLSFEHARSVSLALSFSGVPLRAHSLSLPASPPPSFLFLVNYEVNEIRLMCQDIRVITEENAQIPSPHTRINTLIIRVNRSSVSTSGLSQDQLAALFEQQQNGGGFNFPAGMQPSSEHNFPQATSLYGSQRTGAMPYGNNDMMQMQGMQSSMVPVRRLADRIGGKATASAANYSSMQLSMPQVPTQVMPQMPNRSWPEMPQMPSAGPQYLPMRTPEMPYYAQQISELPVAMPTDYAPVMVENRPAEMMLGGGYVPCDVLPRKAATIHDIWSGSNFCEEVAEMLQATGSGNYFSQGVGEPKMHPMNRGGLRERDMANKAGIGIALQRDDYSGIIHVKRIAPGGSAAVDGRLRVSDVILAVDGISTASIGQELTSLIIGPEGTFVELIVEHSSGQEETIRIRRGAPQQLDDALNLPYHYYKTDDELPYYLSAMDKKVAKSEVSSRIAEMRKRILFRPDVPSSNILSLSLMDHGAMGGASNYGVYKFRYIYHTCM